VLATINSNKVICIKATHFSKNAKRINLKCTILSKSGKSCKKIFRSTAQLNHHLAINHTSPADIDEVNRVKKTLVGISLGLEIGVLQA